MSTQKAESAALREFKKLIESWRDAILEWSNEEPHQKTLAASLMAGDPHLGRPVEYQRFQDFSCVVEGISVQLSKRLPVSMCTVKEWARSILDEGFLSLESPTRAAFGRICQDAINSAYEELLARCRIYEVLKPVAGMSQTSLPNRVGRVEFIYCDVDVVRTFTDRVMELSGSKLRYTLGNMEENLSDSVIAVVEVSAIDPDAAASRAIESISEVVDVLNFFSDVHRSDYRFAPIYLPGLSKGASHYTWSFDAPFHGRMSVSATHQRRESQFDFGELISAPGLEPILHWCSEVLTREIRERGEAELRVLRAVRWMGRATVETASEISFIAFATGLETLLLGPEPAGELTYRLCSRIAHLLGRTLDERQEIFATFKGLYDIRSRIVHAGNLEVSQCDLAQLSRLAKSTIGVVLDRNFDLCIDNNTTNRQFDGWFETRLLG